MKEALSQLFPPDVPPVTRWRLAMAAGLAGCIGFIGWAISPAGFALAGDMKDLQQDVTDIKISIVEQQLYDAKETECTSTSSVSASYFAKRVLQLQREFHRLAGFSIDIPPCKNQQGS